MLLLRKDTVTSNQFSTQLKLCTSSSREYPVKQFSTQGKLCTNSRRERRVKQFYCVIFCVNTLLLRNDTATSKQFSTQLKPCTSSSIEHSAEQFSTQGKPCTSSRREHPVKRFYYRRWNWPRICSATFSIQYLHDNNANRKLLDRGIWIKYRTDGDRHNLARLKAENKVRHAEL